MRCDIEWLEGSLEPWSKAFRAARRSTLPQHLPYALALRGLRQLGARHGLIHVDGSLAGVVQIGEAGLFKNMFHALSLDRGPLFFDPKPSGALFESFFREFRRQFQQCWGRKMRVIPELEGDTGKSVLERCGFRSHALIEPYHTAWLDLTPSPDILRRNLKGKWRNALHKAERSPVEVQVDHNLSTLSAFFETYTREMKQKKFEGPSVKLIAMLVRLMRRRDEVLLINAVEDGTIIASVLILRHGLAATYQCGWTTERGRHCNAHHLLLWAAVGSLKERGVLDLDLGGLLPDTDQAAGLRRFKLGLGARATQLAGAFS